MCQDSRRWNTNLLNNIFCPGLVDSILRVPLLPSVSKDARIWGPSPNGEYAVKSAYHLCMNNIVDSQPMQVDGKWSLIWRLQVPHKVGIFLWQLCRDILPTLLSLQSRGTACPTSCVFCANGMENVWHLFVSYPAAECSWYSINLWSYIEPFLETASSFHELFFFPMCLIFFPPSNALVLVCFYGVYGGGVMLRFWMMCLKMLLKCLVALLRCCMTGKQHALLVFFPLMLPPQGRNNIDKSLQQVFLNVTWMLVLTLILELLVLVLV